MATLVATGIGLFMVLLDGVIANVALPEIQRDFGVGESGLQWVVTAYTIGMATFIMAGATAADRFGRKRLFILSLTAFTLTSLAAGLAPSLTGLTLARALQGVAAATLSVTSLALVSAAFPQKGERAKAIGLWMGVANVAGVLGPTVGGVLTETLSWRAVFVINAPIAVLVLALTFWRVTESRGERQRGFDWGGQLLFIAAMGSLSYGIIQGQEDGWGSTLILTLLTIGATCLAVFAWYEFRMPSPMMDVRLFGNRIYAVSMVTIFSAFFGVYGMLLIITQYFQNIERYSPELTGLLILPSALSLMVLSPIAGRLAQQFGPLPVARIGQPLLFVGLTTIALGMPISASVVAAGLLLTGAGGALVVAPITTLAMTATPADRAGMGSGIMSAQRAVGTTFGFAVTGTILATWVGSTLDASLREAIPEAAVRRAVVSQIVDEADPYAYTAEVSPRRPLPAPTPAQREEIVSAARQDFIDGSRLGVGVGAAFCGITAVLLWTGTGTGQGNQKPASGGRRGDANAPHGTGE
ncbi:DHA2 family efflux MFS transporter permease subunit [Streptomyces sp. SCSIO 30461]|uniref:DHA2 family efflux MFS transporter permease subunit n=1 Tax=Streptomyces sp. SCSIO 30461 TaxID=3118085 RepID=UPI0030D1958F